MISLSLLTFVLYLPLTHQPSYLTYLLYPYPGHSPKKGRKPGPSNTKGVGSVNVTHRRSLRGMPAKKYNDNSSVLSDDGYDGDNREGDINHSDKLLDYSLILMTFTGTIITPHHRIYF